MFLCFLFTLAVAQERVVIRELITDRTQFPPTLLKGPERCDVWTGDNIQESYESNGAVCERTCDEPWKLKCYQGPGCRCARGTFRCPTGACAELELCSEIEPRGMITNADCGPNEVLITRDDGYPVFEPTCQSGNVTECYEKGWGMLEHCRCAPGYIRDLNVCVRIGECATDKATTTATTTPKPIPTTTKSARTTTKAPATTTTPTTTPTTAKSPTTLPTTTKPTTTTNPNVEEDDDQC